MKNDNPERIRVARPSFELFESRLGSYKFAVKSFNTLGVLSSDTATFTFLLSVKQVKQLYQRIQAINN